MTFWISTFYFKSPEEACGVTGPGVGSGDLLGRPKTRRTVANQRLSAWFEQATQRHGNCPAEKSNYSKAAHAYPEIDSAFTNQREITEPNHPQDALAVLPALNASLRDRTHSLPNVKAEPRRELARRMPQDDLDFDVSLPLS